MKTIKFLSEKSHYVEFEIFKHRLRFSTSILSRNIKKVKGEPSDKKNFERKSYNAKKTEKGDTLVSPGIVCYAEKKEQPFQFSSLGKCFNLTS